MGQIEKAIILARINTSQTLYDITGSGWTGEGCMTANTGVSLTNMSDTNVANCWTDWDNFTDTVSEASGVNIRNIVDPWGQPYYVDENEGQVGCTKDDIGSYVYPHVQWGNENIRQVSFSLPSCV